MCCNKRQFALDVRDVRVLKFGCTGSVFWAFLRYLLPVMLKLIDIFSVV